MVPPEYTVAEAVRLHNCIVNVGAIFRRRVVERIGGWDPSFTYLADFDWCVRAHSVGRFLRHPEPLACWRNHPGSANYAPGLEAAREQTRLLDKIYAADDLGDDVVEVRDEAYRNAFIVAAFAMGGVNRADGRFFVHDTLAREVSSRMPETDAEMNARMRQRVTNLEVREKHLSGWWPGSRPGSDPGGRDGAAPCAASRRPRSVRPGGGSSASSRATGARRSRRSSSGRPSEVVRRPSRRATGHRGGAPAALGGRAGRPSSAGCGPSSRPSVAATRPT